MSIYTELKEVTSEILKEFKQGTVVLRKMAPAAGPADNPGTPTITSHTLDAVVKGVSFKYVSQGFAVASDLEVTSAILSGVTPSEKDSIVIDDVRYKIIQMMKIPAAGTTLAWKFIVRKGG